MPFKNIATNAYKDTATDITSYSNDVVAAGNFVNNFAKGLAQDKCIRSQIMDPEPSDNSDPKTCEIQYKNIAKGAFMDTMAESATSRGNDYTAAAHLVKGLATGLAQDKCAQAKIKKTENDTVRDAQPTCKIFIVDKIEYDSKVLNNPTLCDSFFTNDNNSIESVELLLGLCYDASSLEDSSYEI